MLTKKRVFGLASVLAAAVLAVAAAPVCLTALAGEDAPKTGVVYDSEAETDLSPYRLYISDDKIASIVPDASQLHDGKQSLKTSVTGTGTKVITDLNIENVALNLSVGSKVKVSGFFKASGLDNSIYFRLCGTGGYQPEMTVPMGTYDWTYHEKTFTLTKELVLVAADYEKWSGIGNGILIGCQWHTGDYWIQGAKVEVISVGSGGTEPETLDVLYNSEAESNTDGYRTWCAHEGIADKTATVAIDTAVTHGGKQSLRISTQDTLTIQDLYIENTGYKLDAGTSIKLSGWIKTENIVTSGNGVRFIMNYPGKELALSGPVGTTDWTYYEKIFVLTENVTNPSFFYNLSWSTGTVWFQGFKAEIVQPSDVIYDGDAEKSATLGGNRIWAFSGDGKPVTATVEQDTATQRNGKPSIKFEAPDTSIADLYIPLNYTLKAGKSLKVSAYIKTENLQTTGEGMRIVLEKKTDTGTAVAMTLAQTNATSDWIYFEKTVTVLEDTEYTQVFMNMNWCSGKAWVQGLRIELSTGGGTDFDDPPFLDPEDDDDALFGKHAVTGINELKYAQSTLVSEQLLPETGDARSPVAGLVVAAVSLVGVIAALILRKKRNAECKSPEIM